MLSGLQHGMAQPQVTVGEGPWILRVAGNIASYIRQGVVLQIGSLAEGQATARCKKPVCY
jgi:hypothetical protein